MDQVIIEEYKDIDKDDVVELILTIQNSEFGIPITLAMQPDLHGIAGYYQINNGNFWVAKSGDQIIGTIALLDIGHQQAALRKMFVNRVHRGKAWGVGQKLLTTLVDSAKRAGIKEIFLGTTEKFTRAQQFYEKNGFTEILKQELPGSFPVMDVDVKFYRFNV